MRNLNTLETNLMLLDQNVLFVARQFNQARDTAPESFLGTPLWENEGWDQIQKSGQEYVSLEPGVTGLLAMLTKTEKLGLPSYDDNLILTPYPVCQQSAQYDKPPWYLEVNHYSLLSHLDPLDCWR
jgi:hypothetical protein